jgi:hypothetical protein
MKSFQSLFSARFASTLIATSTTLGLCAVAVVALPVARGRLLPTTTAIVDATPGMANSAVSLPIPAKRTASFNETREPKSDKDKVMIHGGLSGSMKAADYAQTHRWLGY